MKRLFQCLFFSVVFCVFLAGSSLPAQERGYAPVLDGLRERLEALDESVSKWPYRDKCDERCFQPELPKKLNWKTAGPGMYWPEAFQEYWFRKTYAIPEQVAGRDVAGAAITLKMNVSDGGDAYVNGEKVGGVGDGGAVLTDSAAPGQEMVIGVRVYNGTWPGAYMGASLSFSCFDELKTRTRAFIDRVEEAESLIALSDTPENWRSVLDNAADLIDIAAFDAHDDAAYFQSLDAATEEFQKLEGLYADYTLYMDGYSHIDLAWLWDKAEGEMVVHDTLATVYVLLKEYPEWIFSISQAHAVKWMEDDYPEIYAQLQDYYKNGRIELLGGTWSEHDSNLPGGEGMVRQFLYGKRYFRDKFGKDIVVAWTPDSFGYNWNLPQFLVKSGMKGFLTQKLGSNESTRFPHKVFWWQGPDGSRVLTYFPPGGYANSVHRKQLVQQMAGIEKKHGIKEHLVIFGVGDHGGGVTRGHLDRILAIKNDSAAPRVAYTSAEDYFAHLLELSKTNEFPTWNDELYLEHHRGTYTTQGETKKNNRQVEQLLMDAEKLAVITEKDYGAPYPAQDLFDKGWYFLLLNHMHDILPGSGITKVYEDASADYDISRETAQTIIRDSLGTIAEQVNTQGQGVPVLVFNPLSWSRDAVVEHPLEGVDPTEHLFVQDSNGLILPSQIVSRDNAPHILFIARDLPPMGYQVFQIVNTDAPQNPDTDLNSAPDTLENSFIKITYDSANGNLLSLFDKTLGAEMLSDEKPNNLYQAFKDTQNAWEIQSSEPLDITEGPVELVENGPVRMTLKTTRAVGESTVEQYLSLYENLPMLYGRIHMDQRDHNVTSKLAFHLNLLSEDAWFEIPYAAISRKAIAETAADKAKFEVSAHRWVDYTDQDGDMGISLLNDCKYGYDVKHNVLRMTLLRTPVTPDPEADIGEHDLAYALYPHAGDWRAADTSRRGREFNAPAYVLAPQKHDGALPPVYSFFSASPDNVALTSVKRAEDGGGIVLRLVETEGRPADASISLPWAPVSVTETNLIEDEIPDGVNPAISGNSLTVPLGAFEIKTLKLAF